MQPLPFPCPADLIPDATGLDAFNIAYKAARTARVVFVAVKRRGRRWTVTADALTAAPGHVVDGACDAIRDAVIRLVRDREVRSGSSAGLVHITLYDVADEERARELAAAMHAALYGDLEPLARAVPAGS
ncbi:hypothetical protein ACFYXH_38750 [Streptomyces sp. NPDC002730]|uniref:hypothetical protein n=1 Tax=Streptomyces sp. NPDC002730 TaxID=3364662 RepID=UPI00368664D6